MKTARIPNQENPLLQNQASEASQNYFLWQDGIEYGPYDEASVKESIKDGGIPPKTLGRRESETDWKPIEKLLPSDKPNKPDALSFKKHRVQSLSYKKLGLFFSTVLLLGVFVWGYVYFSNAPTRAYNCGVICLEGKGVPKNATKAIEYFLKAAKKGHATAQYQLASMYYTGNEIAENKELAKQWFEKAAEHGNVDSQYKLGKMLLNGDGIAENAELAAKWFEKAAIQGNAQAQNELALQYLDGVGIQKNEALAAEWFEKAAKQDSIDASLNLGLMYKNGRGIPWNENLAMKWLQKAANSHNADAQYNLACIYFEGKAGVKNINLALQLFEKSANQDNSDAQAYLGVIYLSGRNVSKDEPVALQFLNKAAQQGHPVALKCLAERQKSIERQQFKAERAEINRKLKQERELALATLIGETKNETDRQINLFNANYDYLSEYAKINKEKEIKDFAVNKKAEIEQLKLKNKIKDYASKIDLDKFEDASLIKRFWEKILQIQQSSNPQEQMKEFIQMIEREHLKMPE